LSDAYDYNSAFYAYKLQCLKIRQEVENDYAQLTNEMRDQFFKKASMFNKDYFASAIKHFGNITEEELQFTREIKTIRLYNVEANLNSIGELMLEGNGTEDQINDEWYPGYTISFVFADDSTLDITVRCGFSAEVKDIRV